MLPVKNCKVNDHECESRDIKRVCLNFRPQGYKYHLKHLYSSAPSRSSISLQECFPDHFGSKFETALEMLVWEFISRLDELLPVPDFTQVCSGCFVFVLLISPGNMRFL